MLIVFNPSSMYFKRPILFFGTLMVISQFANAETDISAKEYVKQPQFHKINDKRLIANSKDQLQSLDKLVIYAKKRDNQTCITRINSNEWIDRVRSHTHRRVCGTILWVDKLFGDEHSFDDSNFSGKLSLGFRHDESDGFDPKLRVRLRTRLPNVSNRLNAFIGRVEQDSFISNTEVDDGGVNNVGLRSTNDEEDQWLIGLGYRNPTLSNNGFDFSVGAKVSSGLKTYAKLAHRHLFQPSDRHAWRTTQTLFWQADDKFGISSSLDYTYFLNPENIIEWDTSLKYTEASERTEWITSSTWHHSITQKHGISSRAYVRGETEKAVKIPEFGVTFTHIQPFLRPWCSIQTGVDFRWEKNRPDAQEYQSIVRFSLQFQMLLGDYYGPRRRR